MKLFLSISCFIGFSLAGLGQQSFLLEVRDAHTDLPVTGAYVRLLQANDTLYTVTDPTGRASFKSASPGRLEVSHISYMPYVKEAKASQTKLLIYLTPSQGELDEVVVTGQSLPTLARESVRRVQTLDAKRIQRQAAVNLNDVLRNQLNFQISEDAILGSQTSLQGLSGAKVKILIDGVPMLGRLNGELDLNQINLNDIERIELVEGPMSVQYGTDAVAGTINLITKRKATTKPEVSLNSYYESVGRYNADGTIWFPLGKWHNSLSLGRNFFDGFDDTPDSRSLSWNPKEQYFTSIGTQRRFKNLLLRYRGEYFYETITNLGPAGSFSSIIIPVDTGAWVYPRALDDYYKTTRLNNAVYADYYLGEHEKINGFIAYNHFKRQKESVVKNLNDGTEQPFGGLDAQDTTVFGQLSSRSFYTNTLKENKLSYQIGYDFFYELNRGKRIAGNFKTIADAALFVSVDYSPVSWLVLQPGLRYAYNSRFDAPLITSLATRFELDKHWIMRASYGRGFRAPTLKELYFFFVDENHNILGNEDLTAETSDNYQAGINYSRQTTNGSVSLDFTGFFNNIKNEIRLIPIILPSDQDRSGLFVNNNIAQTQTSGGTFTAQYRFKGLEAEGGASLIGIKNNLSFSEEAASEDVSGFRFNVQYRLSVSYNWEKAGLTPSIFLNHLGARKDLTTNAEEDFVLREFAAYSLLDFTLQKRMWSNRLTLSVGVKNLMDVTDQQVTGSAVGGSAHSAGSSSVPLSYGRTYFGRLQIAL